MSRQQMLSTAAPIGSAAGSSEEQVEADRLARNMAYLDRHGAVFEAVPGWPGWYCARWRDEAGFGDHPRRWACCVDGRRPERLAICARIQGARRSEGAVMNVATENLFPLFAQPDEDERLTPAEARDVLLILGEVAARLGRATNSTSGLRRRLDAIAGSIVAFMDQLDGDPDLEEQCEDEGAQCDDEGERDDNGLGDNDGEAEQWGSQHRYGGWVT